MKPILFNTEMVKAILDGRKTVTRRVVKPQPERKGCLWTLGGAVWTDSIKSLTPMPCHSLYNRAPYKVGDILYVQETWLCTNYDYMDGNLAYGVEFRADKTRKYFEFDDNERFHKFGKFALKNGWQSPYFMPKEAARIYLKVTNVKAAKLNEIMSMDCLREGIRWTAEGPLHAHYDDNKINATLNFSTPIETFKSLWDSTIKKSDKSKYGWKANPWVWVYEFERVDNPEADHE